MLLGLYVLPSLEFWKPTSHASTSGLRSLLTITVLVWLIPKSHQYIVSGPEESASPLMMLFASASML